MRVATKIVTLTAVLLALLVLVLALHLWWVQRLAAVTRSLPETTFRVSAANLELGRQVSELREFTRKVDVSGADYAAGLAALRTDFEQRLERLATLELAPSERRVAAGLEASWRRYRALPPLLVDGAPPPTESSSLERHLAALDGLRRQLRELARATDGRLAEAKAEVAATVSLTQRVAWLVVAVALLLALPTLWWTIRSIHRPLRRLTAGTRDVAAGRFALELDEKSGDELAEVAASFNDMVRRLRELDELKRDFLSHVSHELNTPLVAMRETNELLLDGLAGPLTREQVRMLELNRDGAVRLSGMIRKILDLSRLEADAMEYDFQPLELGELLRTAVDEFAAAARERDLRLELDLPRETVRARGDRDRLLQVMENLLANALKFAPEGSRVRVALELPRSDRPVRWRRGRDGETALLSVADEGPGVPRELRERIFEKFHRGSRRGSHGFGLGLAISREIVGAHGGRIWVRENSPRGSVFGVELATLRTVEAPPREARQAGAAMAGGGSR